MNHCCKWPNYDLGILQGSVATVLRWGGKTVVINVKVFRDVACEQLVLFVPYFLGIANFVVNHFIWPHPLDVD